MNAYDAFYKNRKEEVKKTIYIVSLLLLFSLNGMAQVKVEARLDSAKILIGQQTGLHVSVTAKDGAHIQFPVYDAQQEMVPGIEVVETAGDTLSAGDGQKTFVRSYVLTSWDENKYQLPALQVKVDGKAYPTQAFALEVQTVEVDTLNPEQIRPAKGIVDNPFSWEEWMPLLLLVLLALALAAGAWWLWHRLCQNKPLINHLPFMKRLLPHQKAMQEIEQIKAEQLSRSEDAKAYYTRLTDTLRQYLEDRFGFNAKEMTSGEIIARLKQEDKATIAELRELFETADLVKFAKFSTQANENEMYLAHVVKFIDATKQDEQQEKNVVQKPVETADSRRNRRERMLMQALIGVLSLLAVAVLAYVGWQVYELMA